MTTRSTRQEAARIMRVAIRHNRRRHYVAPPHEEWGCTLECFGRKTGDKVEVHVEGFNLALQVGGLSRTPDGRYAPGWVKPA